MSVKKLRKSLGLTQKEASEVVGIPLRTYVNFENDSSKENSIKYLYIEEKLTLYGQVDEEHGLLSLEQIKEGVSDVLSEYDVEYCYLFGSYAKKKALEKSDIDLLISTDLTGIKFYGLIEKLRERLKKKVDVITLSSIIDNKEMLNDILREGIKIHG